MSDTDKPQLDEKPAAKAVKEADAPEVGPTQDAGSHSGPRSRSLL